MKNKILKNMKSKKINVLCALVAVILSLSSMQIVSGNSCSEINCQQVGVGASVAAYFTEGGTQGAWVAVAGMGYGTATVVGYGAVANTWNPLGWVGYAVAGVGLL